jgi:DNA-binding response OmpR family regulator
VTTATDGKQALSLAAAQDSKTPFDLVVLDIMLPGLDGREVCRRLKKDSSVPVLMLTALGEIHQKLRGFDAGADDYLPKPFEPMELVARVKALLKRSGTPEPRVTMGSLVLDTANLVVVEGTVRHSLPAKEFELLEKFARSPGRLFTRDQLLDAVWGSGYAGSDRTVDVYINRLRTKFPEEQYGYRIVPVRGVGYRLEVEA